ncbi:hypothetical protein H4219_002585 [Mycoemilia scoparia]|uniref:Enoyl reductase (ER) domain-containing protein n=1 Tax=Mycoemilia scoparia TaxID=417184 RepID=A0A9W8DQC8_9FUNG|nr:hypothetical protein H4219_002585 [Mycoemilia scoparia]
MAETVFKENKDGENMVCLLRSANNIDMTFSDIPVPRPGEVQINVKVTGICGSDVHYWKEGRIGDFVVKGEMILGHESAGIVTGVGEGVANLKVGDRVALEPGWPCFGRGCLHCREGTYNLCPDMKFAATPPYHGTLANYICQPAEFCYKLPDNVSLEEGALIEPLAVALQATHAGQIEPGQPALVLGAGPVGLLTALCAQAAGASPVMITDIDSSRLEFAKGQGVQKTCLVSTKLTPKEQSEVFRKELGYEPYFVFECSGAEPSTQTAIYTARSGATIVLVGMGKPEIKVPIVDIIVRQITLKGTFRYMNAWEKGIRMVASGQIKIKDLVTHRFDLKDSVKAFETASDPKSKSVKVQIFG